MDKLYEKCIRCRGGWSSLCCSFCNWGYIDAHLSVSDVFAKQNMINNQHDIICQLDKDKQDLQSRLDKQKAYNSASHLYMLHKSHFANTIRNEYEALKKNIELIIWPLKDGTE
jgi:hypothetical protein